MADVNDAHLPSLDGLRAAAALMVVYFHAGLCGWTTVTANFGDIGVMLFFSLSSFLMAYLYTSDRFILRYWLAFYIRRYVRLYPVFFIATFAVVALHFQLPWVPRDWHELTSLWRLDTGGGIFWTVPAEMRFYAFYPAIAVLCLGPSARLLFLRVIIAAVVVFIIHGNDNFMHLDIFFLGGITAALLLRYDKVHHGIPASVWDITAVTCLLVVFVILLYNPLHLALDHQNLYNDSWFIAPLLSLCVLSTALSGPVMQWLLANPAMRFIGKISYSMYLTHIFVEFAAMHALPGFLQNGIMLAILVFLTAILCYFAIEMPCHSLARKIAHSLESAHSRASLGQHRWQT